MIRRSLIRSAVERVALKAALRIGQSELEPWEITSDHRDYLLDPIADELDLACDVIERISEIAPSEPVDNRAVAVVYDSRSRHARLKP